MYVACSDFQIEREQAAQDFPARCRVDGITRLAAFVLVETVPGVKVLPAVAGEDCAIHRRVERAQLGDIAVQAGRGVKEVVGLGEPELACGHHLSAMFVVALTASLGCRACSGWHILRKSEGLKAVGGRITYICAKRRSKFSKPSIMKTALQNSEK